MFGVSFTTLTFVMVLISLVTTHSSDDEDDDLDDLDSSLLEKDEDGVLILTNENFGLAVQLNDFLLVHFYKEYCDGCEIFAKDFGMAARNLTASQSHVVCGKMDLTHASSWYELHDIPHELPHVKLYREAEPTEYTGGPLAEQVLKWLDRKAYYPLHEAFDLNDAKNLIDEFPVAIFAFLDEMDGKQADIFANVSDDLFEYQFIVSNKPEIRLHFGVEAGTVLMFKHDETEKIIKYEGDFNYEQLKKWVAVHAVPLVPELIDEESVKLIFGSEYDNFLWILLSKQAGHFEKYLPAARRVAKDFREQIMFVVINTDIDDKLNILELLRLDKNEVPAMRIVRLASGVEKFRPETNKITEATIREFVGKYMKEEGYLYTYGDEPIKDWDKKPVKELVTSNFDGFVKDPNRNVLVEFYSPGCSACKKVEPIFEAVATLYQHARHIELARINMEKNDVKGILIMMYPTFKFFNTTNHIIDFEEQPTFNNFEKFLDKHSVGCQSCWRKNESARNKDVKDEL